MHGPIYAYVRMPMYDRHAYEVIDEVIPYAGGNNGFLSAALQVLRLGPQANGEVGTFAPAQPFSFEKRFL